MQRSTYTAPHASSKAAGTSSGATRTEGATVTTTTITTTYIVNENGE